MADTKISELNPLTGANLQGVDLLPIVDLDINNDGNLTDKETKCISITELRKNIISVNNVSGDGSLSYDTGVISYTGPSAAETRAHFSGGTGVSISSGEISIGQPVGTGDNVEFNQVTATLVGNADTATSLANSRTIALDGDVSGSASFDGSENITITATIADDSHSHIISDIDDLQNALNTKQDNLTFGLASGNTLKSEEALTTNDILLAGTSNIKGRTFSELKEDLSLDLVENKSAATLSTEIRGEIVDSDIPSTITRDSELTAHTSLTNNPHSVTATQVDLGNVTNESKATMFTSPTFTGTTTIPTLEIGSGGISSNSFNQDLNIFGHSSGGVAPGASINITGGSNGQSQNGGDVTIAGGPTSEGPRGGNIYIRGGDNSDEPVDGLGIVYIGDVNTREVRLGNTTTDTVLEGDLDVNNKEISNATFADFPTLPSGDPTAANHAAPKHYVDAVAEGLHVHEQVEAITTGTLASATGGTITYDNGTSGVGATLTLSGSPTANFITPSVFDNDTDIAVGKRVLVNDESNQAHNGIYTVTSSTVLTRATDFDTPIEMAGGDFLFVTSGDTFNNTGFVLGEAVTTVGTSNIHFIQFSGAGAFTAGDGLTLTGTEFSVTRNTEINNILDLEKDDGNFIVGNGSAFIVESGATARTSIGLGNVTNESKATMFTDPTFTGDVNLSRIAGDNEIRIEPTQASGDGHDLIIQAGRRGTGHGGDLYLYGGQGGGSGDGGDVIIDAASGDDYGQIRIGTDNGKTDSISLGHSSTPFTISNQSGFRTAIGAAATASPTFTGDVSLSRIDGSNNILIGPSIRQVAFGVGYNLTLTGGSTDASFGSGIGGAVNIQGGSSDVDGDINIGVTNTNQVNIGSISDVVSEINSKAPKANPTFTGNVNLSRIVSGSVKIGSDTANQSANALKINSTASGTTITFDEKYDGDGIGLSIIGQPGEISNGTGGDGGDITITGGQAGSSESFGGDGGDVTIRGGNNGYADSGTAQSGHVNIFGGGVSGTDADGAENGGDVNIQAGPAGSNSGNDGDINIGTSIAETVNIGASGKTTTINSGNISFTSTTTELKPTSVSGEDSTGKTLRLEAGNASGENSQAGNLILNGGDRTGGSGGGTDGNVQIGLNHTNAVQITPNTTISGTLTVTGAATLNGGFGGTISSATITNLTSNTIASDTIRGDDSNNTAGGSVLIRGGNTASNDGHNGGDVNIQGGQATDVAGGGDDGDVNIGTSNTEAVNIGSSNKTTTINGTLSTPDDPLVRNDFGIASIRKVTSGEYNSITPDDNTLYIEVDGIAIFVDCENTSTGASGENVPRNFTATLRDDDNVNTPNPNALYPAVSIPHAGSGSTDSDDSPRTALGSGTWIGNVFGSNLQNESPLRRITVRLTPSSGSGDSTIHSTITVEKGGTLISNTDSTVNGDTVTDVVIELSGTEDVLLSYGTVDDS